MPKLHWIGRDQVVQHHRDVPVRALDFQYRFAAPTEAPSNSSENRIIHGDNLDALKSLLPEFEGQVNCIYIDPPYNTGNEGWVYNDAMNDPKMKKWLGQVVGKEGEDLTRHDKWLCMMYPRLKLLHRLLADDGVIFISIDDIELVNLNCICDEVFKVENKVGILSWEKKKKGSHLDKSITNVKEYVLVYCKDKNQFPGLVGHINYESETYPCINPGNLLSIRKIPKGVVSNYAEDNVEIGSGGVISSGNMSLKLISNLCIKNNTLIDDVHIESEWRYSQDEIDRLAKEGALYFTRDLYLRRVVTEPRPKRLKDFLPRVDYRERLFMQEQLIKLYESNASYEDIESAKNDLRNHYEYGFIDFDMDNLHATGWGSNEDGDDEVRTIFNEKLFDFPKPSKFIAKLVASYRNKNAIVLDSFSGSGTTAHAILKLNQKDGGNRRFILVETMDYAETITAERVRRVISGYGEGSKAVAGLGGGFDFYRVGERLFDELGHLNPAAPLANIRAYIAWQEGLRLDALAMPSSEPNLDQSPYWLGTAHDSARYFCYEPNAVVTLDFELLASLKINSQRSVIYADVCTLGPQFMAQRKITFKKIPRDIARL
jgi:adenine-specific DNA-methyltransferase